MQDNYNAIGFCPNCGRTLNRVGNNTLCFRLGNGTMFLNATYECCPYCGLDEDMIENFYKALEDNVNKVILELKGD